jgi:hypothetical protein
MHDYVMRELVERRHEKGRVLRRGVAGEGHVVLVLMVRVNLRGTILSHSTSLNLRWRWNIRWRMMLRLRRWVMMSSRSSVCQSQRSLMTILGPT